MGTTSRRSGGGVVWRDRNDRVEILVVHRRRQGDWVLPKGGQHRSETLRRAALREVREESGWMCETVQRLCTVSRWDRRGRGRTTTYFEMRPVERGPMGDDECDRRRWVTPARAAELLTGAADQFAVSWFTQQHENRTR